MHDWDDHFWIIIKKGNKRVKINYNEGKIIIKTRLLSKI